MLMNRDQRATPPWAKGRRLRRPASPGYQPGRTAFLSGSLLRTITTFADTEYGA
jgi:hypothetical protein